MWLVETDTGGLHSARTMALPPIDLLICAYLGHKFLARSQAGTSYDRQAEELGLQNALSLKKLANGGTIGLPMLYELAAALTDGSVDALAAQAKRWWGDLPDAKQSELSTWAEALVARRPRRGLSESATEAAQPKTSRHDRLVTGDEGVDKARGAAIAAQRETHVPARRVSSARIKRASERN